MIPAPRPLFLAGRPVDSGAALDVLDKHSGQVAARVALADPATIDRAIAAAVEAAPAMRRLPTHRRREALARIARRLGERTEEVARTMAIEAGKPIRDARAEVGRAIDTFRTASEECGRLRGEFMDLDIAPRADGLRAVWKRVPVGPCSFITPFNFPLNLVAHKVAPAIAAGCPFVLKPASKTPLCALIVAELLAELDLPAGAFSILACSDNDAAALVEDDRIKLLSFTGSQAVGWSLKSKARKKKVVLELGGNAACIVDAGADLDRAADRITAGAFGYAGQSCISVQRIFAHRSVYTELSDRLVQRARSIRLGPPLEEATALGPMISVDAAERLESWVREAVDGGARVLCGGRRNGAMFEATLLENVSPRARLSCQEAFGPIATLAPFDRFEEALRAVNDSDYGLQAGVFTRDVHRAFLAWDELEVGGVVINDVPTLRVESMPYGGVKESGLGREGVRFAMEELTEIRLMLLSHVGEPGAA